MDFIPLHLHAAIREDKLWGQGNADVTQYFQAAIDFTDPTNPSYNPGARVTVNVPFGRYYVRGDA